MKIEIKKPCHEDWNKMTPNEKGAFCAVCTKDVMDFSKKTIQEIKVFFSRPRTEKICGRFKEEQLTELSFDSFFERFTGLKLSKKVLILIAFSFITWISSSNELNAQSKNHYVLGGPKVIVTTNAVTPKEDNHVKGKVKVNPKDTTKCDKPAKNSIKMGEVDAKPPKQTEKKPKSVKKKKPKSEPGYLKGDVAIEKLETK